MEIVSEEVSARMASMSIKYGEEGTLGPPFALFLRWLLHVQHDRHSVFIVVSYYTLVSIGSICFHDAILLDRELGGLEVGQLDMGQLHFLRR